MRKIWKKGAALFLAAVMLTGAGVSAQAELQGGETAAAQTVEAALQAAEGNTGEEAQATEPQTTEALATEPQI
ncbi:MAG: hypothetical protein Q4C50_13110, partial [Eubacteriales bacterium]|nr:hypothetical protein [Eubacteriales bacterium]